MGFSFTKKNCTDLIVIDEADEFIFHDPKEFDNFVGDNPCICLTATPVDETKNGLEDKIIKHLGLQIINIT